MTWHTRPYPTTWQDNTLAGRGMLRTHNAWPVRLVAGAVIGVAVGLYAWIGYAMRNGGGL